jgi:hypothetical protein
MHREISYSLVDPYHASTSYCRFAFSFKNAFLFGDNNGMSNSHNFESTYFRTKDKKRLNKITLYATRKLQAI